MRTTHIGKICPYCKTPLVENDTVAFCSDCDVPHHLSCWQSYRRCATTGCTGTIKEIVENHVAAAAVSPKPIQPAPAIDILYESREMTFWENSPIMLENTTLAIDRTQDKLFAHCTFRSIMDKTIKAVLIEVFCLDVWGSPLGEPFTFQYLDLQTQRESQFGQATPIHIPEKTTRKLRVSVKKVLFADDTVLAGGAVALTMPAPVLLSQHLQSEDLAAEYARETTPAAQYVPEYADLFWRCSCGSVNTDVDEACYQCGCTKALLCSALNPELLSANMATYAEQVKEQEEALKAEQAERRRLEEEQARREQEVILIATRKERQQKRRKRTIIALSIALAAALLLGCGTIFLGIPLFRYYAARSALQTGQYDAAYHTFLELDGFLNSPDLANEALYQKATAALQDGQYDEAYEIFTNLSHYANSAEMANKTLYQKAIAALQNRQFDAAYEIFTNLGNYANSAEMVSETRYQEGLFALEDKQYDTAIQIFENLGKYKDSVAQLLEAKYQKAEDCQSQKNYKEAYRLYSELGNYKNSQDELLTTVLLWEALALGSSSTTLANSFARTVKLNASQYELFYSTILLYLSAHENSEYWFDWGGTSASKNVLTMLNMLPSSYQDTAILQDLFVLLAADWYDYADLYRKNESLMRQCWSLAFIQDMASQDDAMAYFLEGYWTTNGGSYYLHFYEYEDGGTYSNFTLPWVAKPSGTKYYDINEMIYCWENEDGDQLAKVFRFTIIDYDTIEVYCYKNSRTYILYR